MTTQALRYPLSLGTAALLAVAIAGVRHNSHPTARLSRGGPGTQALSTALHLPQVSEDTAVFAGGCFWGIEGVFEHVKGVTSAVSGYAGGALVAPSYEQVGSGTTGHAEAVRVVYDPAQITYSQLLQVFFTVAHDPTQRNRQGPDVGAQYRSIAFYRDTAQYQVIETYLAKLNAAKLYARPIVTEIVPLRAFYPAEPFHQNYMVLHPAEPYIVLHDLPKIHRLRREFPGLYQERRPDSGSR